MKKFILLFLILVLPRSVYAASNWDEFVSELANDEQIINIDNDIIGNTNITISKDKTINLNGHTVTSGTITVDGANVTINDGKITSTSSNTLNIVNGGIVTLKSSTIENLKNSGYSVYIKGSSTDDGSKTKLIIDSNSVVSANFALGIQRNGYASYGVVLDVYGSIIGENTINSYNYGAVGIHVVNHIKEYSGNIPEINIYDGANIIAKQGNSGDINADDAPAIYAEGYAKFNISGGLIKGSEAITAFAGEFNITGGELIGIGDFHEAQLETNKSVATGSAIALIENSAFPGKISLNISSANITSEKATAIRNLISETALDDSISSINLSGGKYTGKDSSLKMLSYNKFISGGCYNSVLENNFLENDQLSIVEDDSYYCVGIKKQVSIDEESDEFIDVNIKDAVAGQKVKILSKKVNGYKISNLIVKTTSGKIIEVNDGSFVMPNEAVVIEVEYIEDVQNPNTIDKITSMIISLIISICFIVISVILLRKKYN